MEQVRPNLIIQSIKCPYIVRSQVLILDGDNLVDRPWEEVRQLEDFLGIPNEMGTQSVYYRSPDTGYYCLAIGKKKQSDLL